MEGTYIFIVAVQKEITKRPKNQGAPPNQTRKSLKNDDAHPRPSSVFVFHPVVIVGGKKKKKKTIERE
jgi:hypothetical protein